jgi:phosphohistidine phosphatase
MANSDFYRDVPGYGCARIMLRLLLLRHAEAFPAEGGSDIDRPLTPEGRDAAWRMGAYLMASGTIPDIVLVSPARRTIETMEEIEGALARGLRCEAVPPLYNAGMATLLALIARTPPSIRVLLVIGHNPGLAETANMLSTEGSAADLARLRAQFPAPCLAWISFEAASWQDACQGRGRLDRFITLAALQKSEEGA